MAKVKFIDPPSGWMYGFPKVDDFAPSHPNLPGEEWKQERRQWFIDNGYPEKDVELAMKHCRFWEMEQDDSTTT